jgi:streptogramin lyase
MDVVACSDGQAMCNGRCTNTQTDNANCGACGTACAAGQACMAGRCEIVCPSGQTNCNGTCVSLQADRANCGMCGTMCPAGRVCSMGACATSCGTGLTDCMGSCRDLQTDRSNCGACGMACPSGQVCVMGACATSCPMGQTECGGICVSTQTDRANCGMCGNACAAGQICNMGTCELSCATGQTACGMPAACTNLQSDRANCGMCGNACASGLVCDMGMCVPSCRAGQTNCMGSCTSTETDPNHCGMCGNVCGPYANAIASCASSMCIMTCNAGFNDCNSDRMDGCEVQTGNDVNNCGRCGNVCNLPNATPACNMGACRIATCNPGFENADGITENGCETRVVSVGSMGTQPFSDGTISGLTVDPMTGAISPSGMVTTTTNDFLWIVNVAESTVSKWDAATNTEIGRYRVGLSGGECAGRCCYEYGCNMPSRVVVDGNGDAYVANRAFGFQGTVTKIAGDRTRCVDRNMNGMIDTSQPVMGARPTVLPYGSGATGVSSDECVLWTANVGPADAVLRAITIDRGDAARPGGYVWVGGFNNRAVYRLDPDTGVTLNTGTLTIQPYGALVTRDGKVWFTSLGAQVLQSINSTIAMGAAIVPNTALSVPGANAYGLAADANGRIWFSYYPTAGTVWGYDPATDRQTRIVVPGVAMMTSGITVDANGNVVFGAVMSAANTTTTAVRFPASAFTPGPDRNTPGVIDPARAEILTTGVPGNTSTLSAVGVDLRGDIWIASLNGNSRLVKVATNAMRMSGSFLGPNMVYSYSDFTGSVRRTSIPQGSYTRTFDLSCANPRVGALTVDGSFPAGSTSTLSVRTAATMAGLAMATQVPIASLPPLAMSYDLDALLRAASVTPRQFVQVTVVMRQSDMGAVPIMNNFNFRWTCP